MPADYNSTAQALSLPISPIGASSPDAPSPSSTPGPVPPWVRNRPSNNNRRLSTPYSRSSSSADLPVGARILRTATDLMNTAIRLFMRLTPLQRLLAAAAGVVSLVVLVLMMVYSHRIFTALGPVAKGWRNLTGGWIIIWLMTFGTAFPPMIGYSTCITIAGFVFGFPGGWPIVATATVAGSGVAFMTSRTVFSSYVDRLVGSDKRFVALSQVLRHDGVVVLAGIRFCPLPYSLSNGFLSTIPSISPLNFALATALATPKLLVHIFIGSRLAILAENGEQMTTGAKVINYGSMVLFGVLGMVIGLFIYRRTMARAKELAREEAAENGGVIDLDDELGYEDLEEGITGRNRLRDVDPDAAALMDDDDISLWETDGVADSAYRDETEPVAKGDDVKAGGK